MFSTYRKRVLAADVLPEPSAWHSPEFPSLCRTFYDFQNIGRFSAGGGNTRSDDTPHGRGSFQERLIQLIAKDICFPVRGFYPNERVVRRNHPCSDGFAHGCLTAEARTSPKIPQRVSGCGYFRDRFSSIYRIVSSVTVIFSFPFQKLKRPIGISARLNARLPFFTV